MYLAIEALFLSLVEPLDWAEEKSSLHLYVEKKNIESDEMVHVEVTVEDELKREGRRGQRKGKQFS